MDVLWVGSFGVEGIKFFFEGFDWSMDECLEAIQDCYKSCLKFSIKDRNYTYFSLASVQSSTTKYFNRTTIFQFINIVSDLSPSDVKYIIQIDATWDEQTKKSTVAGIIFDEFKIKQGSFVKKTSCFETLLYAVKKKCNRVEILMDSLLLVFALNDKDKTAMDCYNLVIEIKDVCNMFCDISIRKVSRSSVALVHTKARFVMNYDFK